MKENLIFLGLLITSPFIGSFLGVVIRRLPAHRPIAAGRSLCDHCGNQLSAAELIPLASWVVQRRRCRHCGEKISGFYPGIELAAAVVVVWAATVVSGWLLLCSCLFGWCLLTLGWTDWRSLRLPNTPTAFLLGSGLIVQCALAPGELPGHLIGAASGFTVFVLVRLIYRYLRGEEGLGFGDAKLAAGLGVWVSWTGLPTAILYGGVLGLIFAAVLACAGHQLSRYDRLPFGAFLAVGGWLVWLYGPLVIGMQA